METELIKTVKGETMEAIFNNCETFSVRNFKNLTLKSEGDYEPEVNYKYKIIIRHSENRTEWPFHVYINRLFDEEVFRVENLKTKTVIPVDGKSFLDILAIFKQPN